MLYGRYAADWRSSMKRTIFLILILIFSLFLITSCGGDNEGGEIEGDDVYTVTFNSLGGGEYEPITVKSGEKLTMPIRPEREGYSFKGWFNGETRWAFATDTVTSDLTLTATYTPTKYSINYDLNGGKFSGDIPTEYTIETAITLPTPTRGESIFDGWYIGDVLVTEIPTGNTGDVTLKAYYYDVKPEVLPDETGSAANVRAYAMCEGETITLELIGNSKRAAVLRIEMPESWHYVKLEQGTRTSYAEIKGESGHFYVDFRVDVGGYTARVTPLTYSNDLTTNSSYGTTLSNGTVVDVNYYPGFVRKAVTFTIDDGDLTNDEIFLSIVKPGGIKGTFNVMSVKSGMYELYEGYEVANHHVLHTTAMKDNFDYSQYEIVQEYLPSDADPSKLYLKSQTVDGTRVEGLYYVHYSIYGSTAGWHPLATDETYIEYLEWTSRNIEETFGEGSCVGFAFPHGSLSTTIKEYLRKEGYLYARKTGNLKATTGFSLPEDRYAWTYNADVSCLNSVMEQYDALRDDGELKFFAFGVHAKDFVGKWSVLEEFVERFGNRYDEFYYASNRDIFEYEDAVKSIVITDEKIVNPSDKDVFVTINGRKTIIYAGTEYIL